MEHSSLILHTIRLGPSSTTCNKYWDIEKDAPFDTRDYSNFKYGSGIVARAYGEALAAKFMNTHPSWFTHAPSTIDDKETSKDAANTHSKRRNSQGELFTSECNRIYVTCSPFKVAPTAAYAVAAFFTECISEQLRARKLPRATFFKIDRHNVFPDDYGKLSKDQRKDMMSSNRNPLQIPADVDLKRANIIFIDDIRITGAHEKAVQDIVAQHHPAKYCTVYVAKFEGEKGLENPRLEADLNHAHVKSLEDLHDLICNMGDRYIITARVCKFLLSQRDVGALERFLSRQDVDMVQTFYNYMVADGYASMDAFKPQFAVVHRVVVRMNQIPKQSSFSLIKMGLSMMVGGGGLSKRALSTTPTTYDLARRGLEMPLTAIANSCSG